MSGQSIGTVVGYVVGSYFGVPQLGAFIGGEIGGYIDPQVIKAPSIGDAQRQTSQAGMPIPKCYGHTPPFAPTLIDGDKVARKVKRKQKQGKGTPTIVESEGFIATRAFLMCEGEIKGVARITRNGKLVYSTQEGDDLAADSTAFAAQLTIYLGTETQMPDPSLEALHGVGNTHAYRGRAYFVVRDDDETQSGGAMNQYRVEIIAGTGTVVPCSSEVKYLAVGNTGSLATSHDGKAWDERDSGVAPTHLRRCCRGHGAYFAVGDGGLIIRSIDECETWDEMSSGVSPTYMSGIAAGPVALVAVGNDGGTSDGVITRSVDGGNTWEPITAPAGCGPLSGVAYGDGRFVSVSTSGKSIVSTDNGATWSLHNIGGDMLDVVYGAGEFMAVGDQAATYTSPVGDAWTFRSNPGGISFSFLSVAYDGAGHYIAGANAGPSYEGIYTSPDNGVTWTKQDATPGNVNAVTFGSELVLGGDSSGTVSWSDDEATFTTVSPWSGAHSVNGLAFSGADPALMPLPDSPNAFYDPWQDRTIVFGNCVDLIEGDAAIWKDVVSDIANRASRLLPPHLAIANMTDEVPGFMLANATLTGTDYVRTLCTFYFADLPEYDDALHAIRRGGAVVATLDPDDLLTVEDEDDDTRDAAIKSFQRVTVTYPDPANKYIATPQTAPRTSPDVTANSDVTIECPIPFSADLAAQKADILQKIAFLQIEGTFKRAFPAEYSRYVPSDPIVFNDRRHLITKTSNDDSMVRFEATYDRPSAYTSLAVGSNAPTPEPQTSNLKGPSLLVPMNLPQLRAADNVPGVYLAVQGMLSGWPGADILISFDGGLTEQFAVRALTPAVIGQLTQDCDDGIGSFSSGEIDVKVHVGGELETITVDQIAARQNGFVIITADLAEVGQFQTADETSDRHYTLSDLTRGELGSVAAVHYTGDRFVLLDDAVIFLPIDPSHAGQTLIFRAVTLGTAKANNPTVSLVFDPGDLVEDGGTPG